MKLTLEVAYHYQFRSKLRRGPRTRLSLRSVFSSRVNAIRGESWAPATVPRTANKGGEEEKVVPSGEIEGKRGI